MGGDGPTRRAVLTVGVAGALAGCTAPSPDPTSAPTADKDQVAPTGTAPAPADPLRQLGIGFGDVVDPDRDWAAVDAQLQRVGVNAVSLAAGRVEWTAFTWAEHGEYASDAVTQTGRDFVAETIDGLRAASDGSTRHLTISVDALVPALIAADPTLAAVGPDGERSDSFASATAIEGAVGDLLVSFCGAIAQRYRPDEIAVAELMFDSSYGEDDLASYRSASGESDWPRDGDGEIDGGAEAIAVWRSAIVADVVGRAAEAVREHGTALAMDVRTNVDDPAAGRPESGHDYALLAALSDRLVLWNFVGLHDGGADFGRRLTAALPDAGVDPSRALVQVGMWRDEEGGRIEAQVLEQALQTSASNDIGAVGLTPLSLLDDDTWDAVARAWG